MSTYRLIVVERDGTKVAELEQATIERVSWELNGPGVCDFVVPNRYTKANDLAVLTREVQVWKDDTCIWWGVPTNDENDRENLRVQAEGVMWYLGQRHFGKAGRTNFLVNGSFDEGTFNGWTTAGVTATVVNGWGMRPGAFQANVWNNAPGGSGDLHIYQNKVLTGQAYYVIRAWYHIRTDMTWIGPAYDSRGLFVERRRQSDNAVLGITSFPIDDNTERGTYEQVVLGIHAGAGEFLNIRCYTPRQASHAGSVNPPGSIIWDDVGLFVMESTSFSRADLHAVVAGIVAHAQDAAYGKSSLNIGTAAVGAGAPTTTRAYQHADHRNILDALEEFPQMGLLDFGVVLNPTGTTKTLTSYYPSKGSTKNDLVLELGRNVVEVRRTRDGRQTKNQIVMLGEGDGPSRDEAGATDASGLGGLTLEDVVNAPSDTFHDVLPLLASQNLALKRNLVTIPALVVNEAATPLIGVLDVGDRVPVRVDDGNLQLNGTYRVVGLELDPSKNELAVTVNP